MTAPDDLARTLAAEVDGIALIIASTSGSAGAPALTAAEAIVAHLASVVSRRDADLRTRIEAACDKAAPYCDTRDYLAETERVIREHGEPLSPELLAHAVFAQVEGGLVQCGWNQAAAEIRAALDADTHEVEVATREQIIAVVDAWLFDGSTTRHDLITRIEGLFRARSRLPADTDTGRGQ